MNRSARFQPPLSLSGSVVQEALERLLESSAVKADWVRSLQAEVVEFQLGDVLPEYVPPNGSDASVRSEQNPGLVLVCQGRVRLVCLNGQQREVSAIVLQSGQAFGGDAQFSDSPLGYRAIAASPGYLVRISEPMLRSWLQEMPQLREIRDRERAIFLKTYLPPNQSKEIHSLKEIRIPAGQSLKQPGNNYYWLRSGEVSYTKHAIAIGTGWQTPPEDWVAKTDVVLYELPAQQSAPNAIAQNGNGHPVKRQRLDNVVPIKREPEKTKVDKKSADVIRFPKAQFVRKLWRQYPYIEQQSASDCGVACLAMISQYWGTRFQLNTLREIVRVGRSGATLKNLATAAETLGYHSRPVRASIGRLAEQKNPWIAHWQGDHYVVVYRVEKDRVLVADPARGKSYKSRQQFTDSWTGYALLLEPTEQLQETEPDKPSLGRFWKPFWQYRSTLFQIVLISLLIQIFGLVTPLFTQVILDKVVVQKSLPTLHAFSIGLVLFGLWRIGLTTVRQYLLDYFSNRMNLTLVSGFISHALMLPLQFFEDRQVGDIITRVQENNKVQMFLIRQAVSTWLDSTMAIVYLGLMFYYNWRLTLLVIGLIPPIVILTLFATPFLRRISREVFSEAAEQNSLLVEMMTGIGTVKTAAAEREIRWRWEDRFTGLLNAQFGGQKLANGLQAVGGIINSLGSTALLWYGASLVIQDQLTIGQFVAFNMLIGNVISPVLSLVGLWDEFQEVLISVERLNDVFLAKPEETPGRPMLIMPPVQGEVRFEDVTFRYDQGEDRNTLQNLSFTVQPGQTIAIVGRSGSGKSTLVRLLQGLYHPVKGRILIDGHDIRHVSPQSFRSQLGVVPQECFLFSGTILDNIRLYRPEFILEQVVEVAKLAEANSFIQELPLGYSTKVGERGSNLSGGQRQRVAIARALLGDPAILILDEATSSLDTESERRFQQNLARISRGRTAFIIAHRLSTVRHADRILVLDKGVLTEQGTHEELVANRGLYYHLAQQQLDL
jgi:ATP-binding cassette, subfamily B, bacterial HlyB/CyaB